MKGTSNSARNTIKISTVFMLLSLLAAGFAITVEAEDTNRTPVEFCAAITYGIEWGHYWKSDGIAHLRDRIVAGPLYGDLSAHFTMVLNYMINLVDRGEEPSMRRGDGNMWGEMTYIIQDGSGTWECKYHGTTEGVNGHALCSGSVTCHGTGAFEGQLLLADYVETSPLSEVAFFTGYIK